MAAGRFINFSKPNKVMESYVIKARAPSRIGIGGGGSDLPAFFERYGGAVLNVAINLFSYTKLAGTHEKNTRIISHDWEVERVISDYKLEFGSNTTDNVDVVKASMDEAGLSAQGGYEITIHSTSPRNSGLAGSSALVASLLAATYNVAGKPMLDRDNFAKKVYHVEREMLKRPGGYQDQYAAVFGGFNYIKFDKDAIRISPLRIEEDFAAEWHSSMMLFDMPNLRKSYAHDLERKKCEDIDNGGESIEYLKRMKEYADGMRRCLIKGEVKELGEMLRLSWEEKKKLPGVTTPEIDALNAACISGGAYGGKLCGAGGGGFMFVVCDVADRMKVMKAMSSKGSHVVNFDFDFEGMVSWRTKC